MPDVEFTIGACEVSNVYGGGVNVDFTLPKKCIEFTLIADEDTDVAFAQRVDFITDNLLYRGEAVPGTAPGSNLWRIRRITIGLDNDVTTEWADGNADFDNIWDDRLILSYS